MKYLFAALLFIFTFGAKSQTVDKTIIVKDFDTELPIEDVTALVVRSNQIFLTNKDGEARFSLKGASNIQLSHPQYEPVTVRSLTLKDIKNIVFLKKSINDLDEIILTKQHPQKILKGLIDNSTKLLTVPARLKIYSREFFKFNGAYTYYNDGILNFQLEGNPTYVSTKILVEQNRSLGVIDEATKDDLLGYNLNNIMENYYKFKYLLPLLETTAKKEYNFLIKGYSSNKDYFLMTATPVSDNNKLQDDFSILYDYKKKIIIEVNTTIAPISLASNESKSIATSKKIYKSNFKTIYRFENSNYFLLSSREEIGFEKKNKKAVNEIEVRNYLVTTNFSTKGYTYKKGEVFVDQTLHNKKNLILSNYWNTSGLKATDEEQLIIDSINEKTPTPE
jgi:hypothetical protein